MKRRPCPASGRKVAGIWWARGGVLLGRILCPVCRQPQYTSAVTLGRNKNKPFGVLLPHTTRAEAAA